MYSMQVFHIFEYTQCSGGLLMFTVLLILPQVIYVCCKGIFWLCLISKSYPWVTMYVSGQIQLQSSYLFTNCMLINYLKKE